MTKMFCLIVNNIYLNKTSLWILICLGVGSVGVESEKSWPNVTRHSWVESLSHWVLQISDHSSSRQSGFYVYVFVGACGFGGAGSCHWTNYEVEMTIISRKTLPLSLVIKDQDEWKSELPFCFNTMHKFALLWHFHWDFFIRRWAWEDSKQFQCQLWHLDERSGLEKW